MLCYTKRGKETYPTDNRTVCSSDNTNTGPSPVGRVAPWWWPLLEVCKSHHICMSLEKCPFIPNANAFLFDWLSIEYLSSRLKKIHLKFEFLQWSSAEGFALFSKAQKSFCFMLQKSARVGKQFNPHRGNKAFWCWWKMKMVSVSASDVLWKM